MLQDSDLAKFLLALETSTQPRHAPIPPCEFLARGDGIFPAEIARLALSLHIAAVMGDAPSTSIAIVRTILQNVGDLRCAPLSEQHFWSQAIAWARAQPTLTAPAAAAIPSGRVRERIVGEACLRLRKQGYTIEIGAYGPQISDASRCEIVSEVEMLIGSLGGLETLLQILRLLRDAGLYHDGFWLFGEVGLGLYEIKRPMIPVGWLLSLALRNLHRPASTREPAIVWKSLLDLATDFAAAHDCQRYSEFEDIDLHPIQFHRTIAVSTLWRELFTLPQMPAKALQKILNALIDVMISSEKGDLGFSLPDFVKEALRLLEWSADDKATIFNRRDIEQSLPLLIQLTGGAAKAVNVQYGDPQAVDGRTQDQTPLFAHGPDRVITLPRAFLAAAVCEFTFKLVWSRLGKRAERVVGTSLEKAIEVSCKSKAQTVIGNHIYYVGKDRYEIDVAARDGEQIVLIETKGKMLTHRSRSGDMLAFLNDYSDSFLHMLSQLIRHENHLTQGRTSLGTADEVASMLPPIKIAVSPLSHGPLSDKVLSNNLVRSVVRAKFDVATARLERPEAIKKINQRLDTIRRDLTPTIGTNDRYPDLFSYLFDVNWMDLGQFLYVLDRAKNLNDAFKPLRCITFSSRDFWTEIAYADRMGLTSGKWRPIV